MRTNGAQDGGGCPAPPVLTQRITIAGAVVVDNRNDPADAFLSLVEHLRHRNRLDYTCEQVPLVPGEHFGEALAD